MIVGDHGRVYLIERQIESQAAIQGVIAAFLEDSKRRGEPAALIPAALTQTDDRD